MNVLFVTRKFPPSVGGMERAAWELCRSLEGLATVHRVSYGGPNRFLPLAGPWLLLRALWKLRTRRVDVVYLQDGLLAPLVPLLKLVSNRPVVVTVHGLEVTCRNPMVRALVGWGLPRADRVVVASRRTAREVEALHPGMPVECIPWGVGPEFFLDRDRGELREALAARLGLAPGALADRRLLLTTGRLVRRKGVAWFVREVVPRLDEGVLYVVAGEGPERPGVERAVQARGLQERVLLLGQVPDEVRNLLYNAADLFVMPNVPVPGDLEGFGLVALEAASCGTPVCASRLDGLVDAVQEGRTGRLLPPEDAEAWARALSEELDRPSLDRDLVRARANGNNAWPRVAADHLGVFERALAGRS